MIRWSCTGRNAGVQKSRKVNKYKQYGDEVGELGGLFTDRLCRAAAIGQLLRQQMFEVGEGDKSLQLQRFLQFVPVTGSRVLERKAAK